MVEDGDRERDEQGRYVGTVTASDVLGALRALDGEATTADVAAAAGCHRRTALNRLTELHDAGRVERRRVGQTYLWTVADDT